MTEDEEEDELEAKPTRKTPAAVVPQHRPSPEVYPLRNQTFLCSSRRCKSPEDVRECAGIPSGEDV